MDALRDHFASHGTIRAWAPLRTFSRVVVVYQSEDSADEAKTYCDGLQIDATAETYVLVLVIITIDRCSTLSLRCFMPMPMPRR